MPITPIQPIQPIGPNPNNEGQKQHPIPTPPQVKAPEQVEPLRQVSEQDFTYVLSCLFYYHAARRAYASLLNLDPDLVIVKNSNAEEVRTSMKNAEQVISTSTPLEHPEQDTEEEAETPI